MTARWPVLSLRARLMAAGLAGATAALLAGGVLLYAAMAATLNRTVAQEARASAADVAVLVDAGRLPDPVPVSGAQVVQVLDRQHRVVGGSALADRLTPLVSRPELADLLSGRSVTVPGHRTGLSGELQVAAVAAGATDARVTVVAAVPTADLDTSRRLLRVLLLVSFPVLLGALAVVWWRMIGSALSPVERLRRGAERIGAGGSGDERLPVPPGRDEIRALAVTLNGMLERLTAAQTKQRAFVADAAHELRSPLATMRTQLEVAARLGGGGELPQDLLPEVDRLAALVEDLLVLARAGDDGTGPPAEEVDAVDLLAHVAARWTAARVPVRLGPSTRTGADAAAVVRAPWPHLVRAVGNLVDNAVRHAATRVDLDARVTPHGVELTVTDDGHGIPRADRERVFDRFARLDEARDRDSGGSGLGLAITRALLQRSAGTVRLEDASPGVRAVVTLPPAHPRAGPDEGERPRA